MQITNAVKNQNILHVQEQFWIILKDDWTTHTNMRKNGNNNKLCNDSKPPKLVNWFFEPNPVNRKGLYIYQG